MTKKQNKKHTKVSFEGVETAETKVERGFKDGVRTFKDMLTPSGIEVLDANTLQVGSKYVRNYIMQGYPNSTYIGWMDRIINYEGNMDTFIYVEPADDRKAIDELTKQITDLMAQLQIEEEKGSIANSTRYRNKIAQLEEEREKIELNIASLYRVGIWGNLTCDTKEQLDKEAQLLENKLKGQKMNFMPTTLRMLDGFKSTLPLMSIFYKDKLRNFNTGAVIGCFPFYNAEISHPNGVFLGINEYTYTPLYLDFYDSDKVVNTNISVFGRAGSGKSYFVSLLMMRSILKGIQHVVIDPEGEYVQYAKDLGGINLDIRPGSNTFINMFEIDEEEVQDEETGLYTGETIVNLRDKNAELLDLITIMSGEEITQEERSLVSTVITKLYDNFGITPDPNSLYENKQLYDENTGELYVGGVRKKMPQFTDFHNLLIEEAKSQPILQKMANQLAMFRKGGPYDLFDCESNININDLSEAPVVNFDVHQLEEGVLRPIGMYIALLYTWEKIVKKNPKIRKRVICDEAWMMVSPTMKGHKYTAAFLEKSARRIRKRNAGLLVSSQNFVEFTTTNEGLAVLSNTAVRMFLKQSETDIDALKEKFNLSDGEKEFLMTSKIGEILIKTDTESTVLQTQASPYEHELLTKKNRVHMGGEE